MLGFLIVSIVLFTGSNTAPDVPNGLCSDQILFFGNQPTHELFDFDYSTAKMLSNKGVFKVFNRKDSQYYVIRFSSKLHERLDVSDIKFESFSKSFVLRFGKSVTTPKSFVVDSNTAVEIKKGLRFNSSNPPDGIVSISHFDPSPLALETFPKVYLSWPITVVMEQLAGLGRGENDANYQIFSNQVDQLIKQNPEWRRIFKEAGEFMQTIFPNVTFFTGEDWKNLFFVVRRPWPLRPKPSLINRDNIEVVYRKLFSLLPPNYLHAAAEFWAINYILGIEDGDSHNALWSGEQIVAIDLAFKSSTFKYGIEKPDESAQTIALNQTHNFRDSFNPIIGKILMELLSDEFKAGLKMATKSEIQSLAKTSGLEINDQELSGLMKRLQFIAN